jgi:hypothetical protein
MSRRIALCRRSAPSALLVYLAVCCGGLVNGCGPGRYIREIEHGYRYPSSVEKLGNYPTDERARCLLVALLDDENACVRCVAVRALRKHLEHTPAAEDLTALRKLVRLLDDSRVGGLSRPVGLMPAVDYFERLPSVRAEALCALTLVLRCDLGLDQAAWDEAIAERYGTAFERAGAASALGSGSIPRVTATTATRPR